MSENDKPKEFLDDDEIDRDRLFIEVPTEPKLPDREKIPSPYDFMSEIYLRGRAFRSLAEGRIPWWVIISGWIYFGGLALLILILALASATFELLLDLVFDVIPLIILCRGTIAKLSIKKHKNKRSRRSRI
jgi:hypothetical protein